ncbi:ABC transporter permease [Baekduia soli]|uniref:ABC transporter permease n=1 Tax=Baekduia soli TaxID=496014 RepID=UPI00165283AA|nr:ABC transporter permease [Baekduia soli]
MSLPPRLAATVALIRRDALIYTSYRGRLVTQSVGTVFTLALFYYVSKLVRVEPFHSPKEYFGFVVVGLVILQVLQSTLESPMQLRQELVAGTFERMALSPFGPTASVASLMIFPFALASIMSAVTLALAVVIFGVRLHWATVALAIPVGLLGALSFAPLTLLMSAVMLRFKQAPGASYIIALVSLSAGLYFPTSLLPGWIRWASEVQPFTPAVELLRHLLLGLPLTESTWVSLAKMVGFAIVGLPLAGAAVGMAIRSCRRNGTLVEY